MVDQQKPNANDAMSTPLNPSLQQSKSAADETLRSNINNLAPTQTPATGNEKKSQSTTQLHSAMLDPIQLNDNLKKSNSIPQPRAPAVEEKNEPTDQLTAQNSELVPVVPPTAIDSAVSSRRSVVKKPQTENLKAGVEDENSNTKSHRFHHSYALEQCFCLWTWILILMLLGAAITGIFLYAYHHPDIFTGS
ncbi:hypothetical protein M3Y95_01034100 [Aphelenchoides besseyi]|nr:hypothetical protein M3Y95_01034100 [Aphelenchoides besseyi]